MIEKIKKNQVLKKISYLFVGRIYAIFISIISNIMLVRYLKPELNGIYNYSIAYITIFSGIALMGLDNILVKEFSKDTYDKDDVFISSFIIRALGSSISYFLMGISMHIFHVEQQMMIWISSIPFFINIFSGITSWFYSNSDVKYIIYSESIGRTLCFLLRFFCIIIQSSVIPFLIIQTFETLFLVIFEWVFFRKSGGRIYRFYHKNTTIYLLKQGLPICLGSIAYSIFMKIDQVMIGQMVNDYELGIYSVAVRIAELWYFVPNTIAIALLPHLTQAYTKEDTEKFNMLIQKSMSWMVLLGYVTSIFTMFFSKIIIHVLYGFEYTNAAPILCIYIWAGVFINMSVIRGNYFILLEWTHCSFWTNMIGAITNVILNIVLIRIFGAIGAAIATLISYATYAYLSSLIIPRLRKIWRIQTRALFLKNL